MKHYRVLLVLLSLLLFFTGCTKSFGSVRLQENKRIYNSDRTDSIDVLYLTVGEATDQAGKTWTLSDLREYVGEDIDVQLPVLLTEGEPGKERVYGKYGYSDEKSNAKIELRGNNTEPKEKSYKIIIDEDKELFHLLNRFNLMKYQKDLSRAKTKFYFDCVSYLEDIPGFRTRFVQVKMREEGGEYQDYGLYTLLEQPNLQYLKAHSLSTDSLVYRAQNFDFYQKDALVSEEDPAYDKEAFEQYLTLSEGSTKHNPLVEMLAALNDPETDIDEVVDRYFSRDNLLSFTALNILMQNTAVNSEDYVLLYRKEDKKWFLTGWSGEKNLSCVYQETKRQRPDSLYTHELFADNLLYRRFYAKPENIRQLERRVEDVYSILKQRAELLCEDYVGLVSPQVVKPPDLNLLPGTVDLVDDYILSFPSLLRSNYEKFQAASGLPYSFDMGEIRAEGNRLTVSWDRGLNAENIQFTAALYRDAACQRLAYSSLPLSGTSHVFENLPAGEYYLKVTAMNGQGQQISRSLFVSPFGKYFYGADQVVIGEGG